jgi:hypothetical protein
MNKFSVPHLELVNAVDRLKLNALRGKRNLVEFIQDSLSANESVENIDNFDNGVLEVEFEGKLYEVRVKLL